MILMYLKSAEKEVFETVRIVMFGLRRKVVDACEGSEVACLGQLKIISAAYSDTLGGN